MDTSELRRLAGEGKTQREIAAILGCSQTNVRYWLAKEGIGTCVPSRESQPYRVPPPSSAPPPGWATLAPNTKGKVAEAKVTAALLREGFEVLLPFGGGPRYDLVTERAGVFRTVQVKCAERADVASFSFRRHNFHRITGAQIFYDDVDDLAIYVPPVDRCFLVPFADFVGLSMTLRLDECRNAQRKCVRWGAPYEIGSTMPL